MRPDIRRCVRPRRDPAVRHEGHSRRRNPSTGTCEQRARASVPKWWDGSGGAWPEGSDSGSGTRAPSAGPRPRGRAPPSCALLSPPASRLTGAPASSLPAVSASWENGSGDSRASREGGGRLVRTPSLCFARILRRQTRSSRAEAPAGGPASRGSGGRFLLRPGGPTALSLGPGASARGPVSPITPLWVVRLVTFIFSEILSSMLSPSCTAFQDVSTWARIGSRAE